MTDIKIEKSERYPFDEMTDIVEIEVNVYGNIIKLSAILAYATDDALFVSAEILKRATDIVTGGSFVVYGEVKEVD